MEDLPLPAVKDVRETTMQAKSKRSSTITACDTTTTPGHSTLTADTKDFPVIRDSSPNPKRQRTADGDYRRTNDHDVQQYDHQLQEFAHRRYSELQRTYLGQTRANASTGGDASRSNNFRPPRTVSPIKSPSQMEHQNSSLKRSYDTLLDTHPNLDVIKDPEPQWSDEESSEMDNTATVLPTDNTATYSKEHLSRVLPSRDLGVTGSRSRVPEEIRLRVNMRERQRMHGLNSALDSLRQVMPYSSGPSVKKLSKMSTLLLARNYIVMLTRSLEEMKRLVQELSAAHQKSLQASPPAVIPAPLPPNLPPQLHPTPNAYTSLLSSLPHLPAGILLPTPYNPIPHPNPAFHHLASQTAPISLPPSVQQSHDDAERRKEDHYSEHSSSCSDFLTCPCSQCLKKRLILATHWKAPAM